jgi:hypothetical protein
VPHEVEHRHDRIARLKRPCGRDDAWTHLLAAVPQNAEDAYTQVQGDRQPFRGGEHQLPLLIAIQADKDHSRPLRRKKRQPAMITIINVATSKVPSSACSAVSGGSGFQGKPAMPIIIYLRPERRRREVRSSYQVE